MARGWESKSVESQQADAVEKSGNVRVRMTPEAAARNRELENLRLARLRVAQQIKEAQNPRHRELLESTLADIDEKVRRLRDPAAENRSSSTPTSG